MSTAPTVSTTEPTATPSERCPVCDHDLTAHDAIGERYCAATQARALTRNCICGSFT